MARHSFAGLLSFPLLAISSLWTNSYRPASVGSASSQELYSLWPPLAACKFPTVSHLCAPKATLAEDVDVNKV